MPIHYDRVSLDGGVDGSVDDLTDGRYVMMADRWVADDLSSSSYVWLPMWAGGRSSELAEDDPVVRRLPPERRAAWAEPPAVRWFDEWDLSILEGEPILA